MQHLKRRSLCKKCRVCFIRDNDTQVFCHSCLTTANYEERLGKLTDEWKERKRKCVICKTFFLSHSGKSVCSDHCHKELKCRNSKVFAEKEKDRKGESENLTGEAKRWLDKKKINNPKRLSYSELNRRAEYNRLFGKYSEASLFFKRKGFGR